MTQTETGKNNWASKFAVGDAVKIYDTIETGHKSVTKWTFGKVTEIGDETIEIQWDDLPHPTEHSYDDFEAIKAQNRIEINELQFNQTVYHKEVYGGMEALKIVGLRLSEVELEGDYSGGTHNVVQKEWLPLSGLLLTKHS